MRIKTDLKHQALRGGRNLALRHILGFLINFIGGVILARYFGPEIIGTYFISFTVFMFGRAIVDFGVLTHFISRHKEPAALEITTAFSLQQLIGFCYVLLCILIVSPLANKYYNVQGISWLIVSAALAAYFYSWQSVPLALFERKVEYVKVGFIEVSELVFFNTAAIAVGMINNDGILGFSVGNVLRGFGPAVIAISLSGIRPSFEFNIKNLKELIKKTYHLFGLNINTYIVMIAPPVILGTLGGLKSYGMSMVAYVFLQYTMVIATVFQRVGLTVLSRLQKKKKEFDRYVNSSLNLLAIIYIPVLMGLASISPYLLPIVYGSKWAGMEQIVLFAAIPLYLTALMGIFTSAIVARGYYQLAMRQSILNTLVYWIAMLLSVKYLDVFTMPFSHLCGILGAGWILVQGYNKYCGNYVYKENLILSLIGFVVMFLGWYLTKEISVFLTLAIWAIFVMIVLIRYKDNLPQLKDLFGKTL